MRSSRASRRVLFASTGRVTGDVVILHRVLVRSMRCARPGMFLTSTAPASRSRASASSESFRTWGANPQTNSRGPSPRLTPRQRLGRERRWVAGRDRIEWASLARGPACGPNDRTATSWARSHGRDRRGRGQKPAMPAEKRRHSNGSLRYLRPPEGREPRRNRRGRADVLPPGMRLSIGRDCEPGNRAGGGFFFFFLGGGGGGGGGPPPPPSPPDWWWSTRRKRQFMHIVFAQPDGAGALQRTRPKVAIDDGRKCRAPEFLRSSDNHGYSSCPDRNGQTE